MEYAEKKPSHSADGRVSFSAWAQKQFDPLEQRIEGRALDSPAFVRRLEAAKHGIVARLGQRNAADCRAAFRGVESVKRLLEHRLQEKSVLEGDPASALRLRQLQALRESDRG